MSAQLFNNSTRINRVVSPRVFTPDSVHGNNHTLYVGLPLNKLDSLPRAKQNVMSTSLEEHPEAYYLYFIATVGIILNFVVVMAIFIRKPLRKMTSGFLIHACFLDFLKSAYCIPIGTNLLSQTKPTDCNFFGASFVILVTTSVFNMVAMVCTEAYTFGEKNIGGNSKGTVICVGFGIILVYVGSLILHLGPTLIGGHFEFHPDIGSCSFTFGKQTGYMAHLMWMVITTAALIAVFHFIHRLYKEIQINRPNRVSFLVRTSITVIEGSSNSTCRLRKIIHDANHRAKMFILNSIMFIVCWYPYFLLIVIDKNFTLPTKVYQTFAFIAWSQGPLQPILYICFDRNLNILAKHLRCDRYRNDIDSIIQMMMNRNQSSENVDAHHRDRDASISSFEYPNNLEPAGIPEYGANMITENCDNCAVQNTSNQNVQNHVAFRHNNVLRDDFYVAEEVSPRSNIATSEHSPAPDYVANHGNLNLDPSSIQSSSVLDNSPKKYRVQRQGHIAETETEF
ncbi:trace amine-associated receptor 4-like [Dreissena polymorpha]|uniref:trace amine-associated receptor 4-like n=1 Tax=Dreissena polymorpha TaxID=45954 RepID=UPI002264F228|nr:trace amine-associated receptor 4-like [Dreissena polymorpha]XP_052231097.1 trace amine-associated receptor 4-like [Dreissena polymorpha]